MRRATCDSDSPSSAAAVTRPVATWWCRSRTTSTPRAHPNVYTLDGTTQSHGDHLNDAIVNLTGEAWTPLSETLFQVYTYFQSRDAADRPAGATSGTFPEYEYEPDPTTGDGGPHNTSGTPAVPDSPVQFDCQKNFVIVITDGEPTKDDFTASPVSTSQGFSSFSTLIGDFNNDGEVETGLSNEGTLYLDDIAKFMQETDFRPDLPDPNGQPQVIDVYTVGFTTSAAAECAAVEDGPGRQRPVLLLERSGAAGRGHHRGDLRHRAEVAVLHGRGGAGGPHFRGWLFLHEPLRPVRARRLLDRPPRSVDHYGGRPDRRFRGSLRAGRPRRSRGVLGGRVPAHRRPVLGRGVSG